MTDKATPAPTADPTVPAPLPFGTPAPYTPNPPQPALMEAPPLTPHEQETLDSLYAELKPQAISGARGHIIARTPTYLIPAMQALIDADFPPDPPPEAAPEVVVPPPA